MKLVLASQSPRRQELLEKAGYELDIHPANFSEKSGNAKEAAEVVLLNAKGKCQEIVQQVGDAIPVVGADTVVVIDGKIIGKPKDAKDAVAALNTLSNRKHQVLTGIAISYQGKMVAEVATTDVYFKKLSKKEITDYVATGEPLDKAGSYGIQGKGGFMVEHIEGNFDNVMGLDIDTVQRLLKKLQVE